MRAWIEKILKRDHFFKSFLLLATGSSIAQIITVISSPISTRLYSPDSFGEYTLITTAVSLFGPILCLKYDMSIVSTDDREEQLNLIVASFLVGTSISLIVTFIYSFFILGNSSTLFTFICLFVLLFSYSSNLVLQAKNNYDSEYGLISKVTIIKSVVQTGGLILLGAMKLGTIGLVLSQVISQFSGLFEQSKSIRKEKKLFDKVNLDAMITTLKTNSKQFKYNTPAALFTTLTYSSINLFISFQYSNSTLGYYSLSYRMLGLPFMLISANFAKIYYKEAMIEYNDTKKFDKTLKKTLKLLLVLIVPCMFILFIIAPELFQFVFGKKWRVSGEMVQILIPMFALRLIVDSLTSSYIVANRQDMEFLLQGSLLLLEIGVYITTFKFKFSIHVFLLLITIVYSIIYFINFIFIKKISKGEM